MRSHGHRCSWEPRRASERVRETVLFHAARQGKNDPVSRAGVHRRGARHGALYRRGAACCGARGEYSYFVHGGVALCRRGVWAGCEVLFHMALFDDEPRHRLQSPAHHARDDGGEDGAGSYGDDRGHPHGDVQEPLHRQREPARRRYRAFHA